MCVIDAGYGHIAPKTAVGRFATIIYATFGIPLTLLTIAHVGKYMAAVFRFTYKNLVCGVSAGVCTCCHSHSHHAAATRDVTGQTTDRSDSTDQRCSSASQHSPTQDHLQDEGHDRRQGEVQGHQDEFEDVVNSYVSAGGEAVELTLIKGE